MKDEQKTRTGSFSSFILHPSSFQIVGPEERLDPRTQGGVASASLVQVLGTGRGVGEVVYCQEDLTFGHREVLGRTRRRCGRPVPGSVGRRPANNATPRRNHVTFCQDSGKNP